MSTQNGTAAKTATGTTRPKTSKATASKSNKVADSMEVKALKTQLEEAQAKAKEAEQAAEKLTKELGERTVINVADALVKVAETKAVADRLEFLQRTRKDLSAFALGSDGNRDVLSLRDGSGNSFESHNSDTIGAVLTLLKKELDTKIEQTESDLLKIA